jgi:Family of unknown function (DUF5675)
MRREELARIGRTVHGTFGLFGAWYSVERRWANNESGVSCLPAGVYVCKPTVFHPGLDDGYPTFEITGVPQRSEIKIHVANWEHQLRGCIALGMAIHFLEHEGAPKLAVTSSKEAFKAFFHEFGKLEAWEIDIRDYAS